MLGLLAEAGCAIVGDGGKSDVRVVNTCGFLSASRDEAISVLQQAARDKKKGRIRRIVVAGCLVQRDGQGLIEDVPEIDALIGVNNRGDILRAVGLEPRSRSTSRKKVNGRNAEAKDSTNTSLLFLGEYHPTSWVGDNLSDRARLRLTPSHYAYLRMSEGCNQKCTFCTIPSIRGPMHCKPVPEIMAEARELIADGAVELNLIGQDTTSYGLDIGYRAGLSGLLRELNKLDGARWIRLMYAYPSDFTDEMIEAIADCDKVVKYIDMPLQHIDDRVLKGMYRRVTRKQTEALLEKLRGRIPGVSIRTTFIAGFPGETAAHHTALRDFISAFEFDAVGVFPYSSEPGTPAHRMKDAVPPETIAERVEELMLAQQDVAFRRAKAMAGREVTVLIDGFGKRNTYPARHAGQAPEVDSIVHVKGGEFDPGEFIQVRINGAKEYDLTAIPTSAGLPILHN